MDSNLRKDLRRYKSKIDSIKLLINQHNNKKLGLGNSEPEFQELSVELNRKAEKTLSKCKSVLKNSLSSKTSSITDSCFSAADPHISRKPSTGNFRLDLRNFMRASKEEACTWRKIEKNIDSLTDPCEKLRNKLKIGSNSIKKTNFQELLNSVSAANLPIADGLHVSTEFLRDVPGPELKQFRFSKHGKNKKKSILMQNDAKERSRNSLAFDESLLIIRTSTNPCVTDFKTKLKSSNFSHHDLQTFKHVWQDILHLETTQKFWKWLNDHPDIEPPTYLAEQAKLFKETKKPQVTENIESLEEIDKNIVLQEFKKIINGPPRSRNISYQSSTSTLSLESIDDFSEANII